MSTAEIRILVVDDDAEVARGTAHLLERAGYVTTTASNGVEALRSMPTFRPHLVLQGKNEALEEFAGEIIHEAERIAGIVRGLSAFATRDIATRAAVPVPRILQH